MKTPLTYSGHWEPTAGGQVGCPSIEFWRDWKREQSSMVSAGLSLGEFNHRTGDYNLLFKPPAPILTDIPQWIKERLRDYQVPAVQGLVAGMAKHGRVLDASQMGTGKTYSALAAVACRGRKPFVVCRRAAIPAWINVGKLFGFDLVHGQNLVNWEQLRTGKVVHAATWVKEKARNGRTYERFRWCLDPATHDVIWDEVHNAKSMKATQNSEMHIAHSLAGLPSLNLSATAANAPIHFRALGFALGLHHLDDFYSWLGNHGYDQGNYGLEFTCGMSPGQRFKKVGGAWVEKPEAIEELATRRRTILDGIHKSIFNEGRGVRLRKCDIADFPKTVIQPVLMDFGRATKEIRAAYDELELRLAKDRAEGTRNRLAIMTEEAMVIEGLKIPTIVEEVKDLMEEGFFVAVFVNYNASMDLLCEMLKTKCCIRGDQRPEVRESNIAKFQAHQAKVIIANSQCGGESVSLHDMTGEHPRTSFIMPSFWSEKVEQCAGRIDRDGTKDVTVQRIPFCADSVEADMWEACVRKGNDLSTLNDGDLQKGLKL